MISRFMNLDQKKRECIINAALEEFARKGYKDASTNEIVKKANISKGLLFHYFGNKKRLFLFIYNYCMDIFLNEFYAKLNYGETDIIKRWKQIVLLKIELIQRYPTIYDFILTAAVEDSAEVKNELNSQIKEIFEDGYKKLFLNIDTSGLKKGVDKKYVYDIVFWVAQGFSSRELDHIKSDPGYRANIDINTIVNDFDKYIELLKNAFYE